MLLQHWAGDPEGRRALRRPVAPSVDFVIHVVARGIYRETPRLHPVADCTVDLGCGLPRFSLHCFWLLIAIVTNTRPGTTPPVRFTGRLYRSVVALNPRPPGLSPLAIPAFRPASCRAGGMLPPAFWGQCRVPAVGSGHGSACVRRPSV